MPFGEGNFVVNQFITSSLQLLSLKCQSLIATRCLAWVLIILVYNDSSQGLVLSCLPDGATRAPLLSLLGIHLAISWPLASSHIAI